MENVVSLPIDYSFEPNYIDCNGLVHVIKCLPEKRVGNNHINIQWNGVGCFQSLVKNGEIVHSFSSDNDLFDHDFWYNHFTRWGTHYPSKLHLTKEDMPPDIKRLWNTMFTWREEIDVLSDKINKWVDSVAVPAIDVLNEIIKEVRDKTGIDYEFGSDTKCFEKDWGEAFVPLKFDGEEYVLTWENCD